MADCKTPLVAESGWTITPALPACDHVDRDYRRGREPNRAEFDKALDAVIGIRKYAHVVDRAKRYKQGNT